MRGNQTTIVSDTRLERAFAFLERCSESDPTYDMTSAGPILPGEEGVDLPEVLINAIRDVDFKVGYTETRGKSKGEKFLIDRCGQFFAKWGINAEEAKISLCDDILTTLKHIYSSLGLNQTNKIILPTPTFGFYLEQFRELGIGCEFLPTSKKEGYLPNPQELEKLIVETGAKALLLCYPNNPTGTVMTEECARSIADVVKRHGVFVISDEAFINNQLSENRHFPIAAVEGMVDQSFTVTSMGKSCNIGIKTGFCVGNEDIVRDFRRLGGYPTKQNQKVLYTAMGEESQEYLERCRQHYLRNIGIVKERLAELSGTFSENFGEVFEYSKPLVADPDATNVYVLDFSGLRGKDRNGKSMETGLDVAEWLLEDASVGVVPGECSLFKPEEMLVRIVLNQSPSELSLAFGNILEAASRIHNPQRSVISGEGTALVSGVSMGNSIDF